MWRQQRRGERGGGDEEEEEEEEEDQESSGEEREIVAFLVRFRERLQSLVSHGLFPYDIRPFLCLLERLKSRETNV